MKKKDRERLEQFIGCFFSNNEKLWDLLSMTAEIAEVDDKKGIFNFRLLNVHELPLNIIMNFRATALCNTPFDVKLTSGTTSSMCLGDKVPYIDFECKGVCFESLWQRVENLEYRLEKQLEEWEAKKEKK